MAGQTGVGRTGRHGTDPVGRSPQSGWCLDTQASDGRTGLEACNLAYYSQEDIGDDGVWDNWRLEGPSFVWHFRGSPHVHVWVNVADDPAAKITTG